LASQNDGAPAYRSDSYWGSDDHAGDWGGRPEDDAPLTPGMTVALEIRTDSHRVIDYLLSPLAKIASEAARER
jgi:hypothetical protein